MYFTVFIRSINIFSDFYFQNVDWNYSSLWIGVIIVTHLCRLSFITLKWFNSLITGSMSNLIFQQFWFRFFGGSESEFHFHPSSFRCLATLNKQACLVLYSKIIMDLKREERKPEENIKSVRLNHSSRCELSVRGIVLFLPWNIFHSLSWWKTVRFCVWDLYFNI